MIDATQVADDYATGPLGLVAGTVGLWHFDEGDDTWCCPTGTTCGATEGCDDPGSGCPVPCNGGCCLAGQVCTPYGCAAAGNYLTCATDHPVACGADCCTTAEACTAQGCAPANTAAGQCQPGDIAVAASVTDMACCPPIDAGDIIGTGVVTSTCSGRGSAITCYSSAGGAGCSAGYALCAQDNPPCTAAPKSTFSCVRRCRRSDC